MWYFLSTEQNGEAVTFEGVVPVVGGTLIIVIKIFIFPLSFFMKVPG
jgi:hypothetical protein